MQIKQMPGTVGIFNIVRRSDNACFYSLKIPHQKALRQKMQWDIIKSEYGFTQVFYDRYEIRGEDDVLVEDWNEHFDNEEEAIEFLLGKMKELEGKYRLRLLI